MGTLAAAHPLLIRVIREIGGKTPF